MHMVMCVFIYIYMYTHIYVCDGKTHAYIETYIHTITHTFMHAYILTYLHGHICLDVQAYAFSVAGFTCANLCMFMLVWLVAGLQGL